MKEDAVKERIEQIEQEECEKQKKLLTTRRSSSSVLRQSYSAQPSTDVVVVERSALSEPIPRHTQFVSFLILESLNLFLLHNLLKFSIFIIFFGISPKLYYFCERISIF